MGRPSAFRTFPKIKLDIFSSFNSRQSGDLLPCYIYFFFIAIHQGQIWLRDGIFLGSRIPIQIRVFLVSGFLSPWYRIFLGLGILIPGIRDFFQSRDFNTRDSGFFYVSGFLYLGFSRNPRELCYVPGIRDFLIQTNKGCHIRGFTNEGCSIRCTILNFKPLSVKPLNQCKHLSRIVSLFLRNMNETQNHIINNQNFPRLLKRTA